MAQTRNWTEKEKEYLREKYGEMPVPNIARNLKRSIDAVSQKAKHEGLGKQSEAGILITANQTAKLIGIDLHVIIDYWIPKYGLKFKQTNLKRNGKTKIIKMDDLIKWLENNQDIWDSRKLELYALGQEYDWLILKRKKDMLKPQREKLLWTPTEDATAISMYKRGITNKQIGFALNRSEMGVKKRLQKIDIWSLQKVSG